MVKKIIILSILSLMLVGSRPVAVYAATITEPEETSEPEDNTVGEKNSIEMTEPIPEEGNGQVVDSAYTAYSDETSSIIHATAIVPTDFGTTVYAQVKNLDIGISYKLYFYKENGYADRCYVPSGNYSFQIAAASGDNANTYSFNFPKNQFFVEPKQSQEFEILLNDYDNVEAQVNERYAQNITGEEADSAIRKTEVEKKEVKSAFEVTHTGTGLGQIGITGKQTMECDVTIKITEEGQYGTSKFIYTRDGSVWSDTKEIPLSGFWTIPNTGLTVEFFLPTPDAVFVPGDTYSFYAQDPLTSFYYRQKGSSGAKMEVLSNVEGMRAFDILERMGIEIRVKILKDGGFGSAVWQISKDSGYTWGEQEFAQREFVVTSDIDSSLSVKIRFNVEDNKLNTDFFKRDDVYAVRAERKEVTESSVGIMIILVVVAVFIGVALIGYFILKNAKPSESDYKLNKR